MDYSRYNDDSSMEGGSSNRMMKSGALMMKEYEPVANRTFGAERSYKQQRLMVDREERSERTRATRKINED
jgi:hypothetical protein